MKAKDIALEALEVFGSESQVKIFAEECVEAAHAALKFDRNGDDSRLVAEIGDLKLVLWQMEQFLGEDRVKVATHRSALKLEKMIGDWKAKRLYPPTLDDLQDEIEVRYEYVTQPCGCCARPKEMGRGLDVLMGDGK